MYVSYTVTVHYIHILYLHWCCVVWCGTHCRWCFTDVVSCLPLCLQMLTSRTMTCQEVSSPCSLWLCGMYGPIPYSLLPYLLPFPLSLPPPPPPLSPLPSAPCAVPEGIYMLETLRRVNVSHNQIRELSSLVGELAVLSLLSSTRELL